MCVECECIYHGAKERVQKTNTKHATTKEGREGMCAEMNPKEQRSVCVEQK
jgi:hypothetical protein